LLFVLAASFAMAVALVHYGKADAKTFGDRRGEKNRWLGNELPDFFSLVSWNGRG
jgi:hypothetical protein